MSDDADDVDADGADDNVGDNDGVFFSPELAQDNGLAENKTRPRGHRKRHPGPPPEAGTPGQAFTVWQRELALLPSMPLPGSLSLGAAKKSALQGCIPGSRRLRLRPVGSRGAAFRQKCHRLTNRSTSSPGMSPSAYHTSHSRCVRLRGWPPRQRQRQRPRPAAEAASPWRLPRPAEAANPATSTRPSWRRLSPGRVRLRWGVRW